MVVYSHKALVSKQAQPFPDATSLQLAGIQSHQWGLLRDPSLLYLDVKVGAHAQQLAVGQVLSAAQPAVDDGEAEHVCQEVPVCGALS